MSVTTRFAMHGVETPNLARWPVLASLLSLASCFALSGTAGPALPYNPNLQHQVEVPLESSVEPAVLEFQPVDPDKAVAMNAAIPEFAGPIAAAPAFRTDFSGEGLGARMTALECLTSAIYYEAASESSQGQRAVAQVVLNRVRHPAYPHSVCGVVFQGSERQTGCQFTFTCDGALARPRNPQLWRRAMSIASAALAGYVEPSVGTATHYHTIWVVPYWQAGLTKIGTVGAHIFYRWSGSWGAPAAFSAPYSGVELLPGKLAALSDGTTDPALSALDGMDSVESYRAPQPDFGPATVQIAAAPRPSLAADDVGGKLLADENRGELLTR